MLFKHDMNSAISRCFIVFLMEICVSMCYSMCGSGQYWVSTNYPAIGRCESCPGPCGHSSCSCSCTCQGTSGTFYGDWTACSVSCGGGTQTRRGVGFDSCGHSHTLDPETRHCNQQQCPVNGAWGVWSSFTLCDKSCGGGMRLRNRTCSNPSPSAGGLLCVGDSLQVEICNNHVCPELVTLTNPTASLPTTSFPLTNSPKTNRHVRRKGGFMGFHDTQKYKKTKSK